MNENVVSVYLALPPEQEDNKPDWSKPVFTPAPNDYKIIPLRQEGYIWIKDVNGDEAMINSLTIVALEQSEYVGRPATRIVTASDSNYLVEESAKSIINKIRTMSE